MSADTLHLAAFFGHAKIAELLRAVWATMLGVIDAWKGKTYQTWQPPQSR